MADHIVNNDVVCYRLGEREPRIKFRVQRHFTIGHSWFFSTREGVAHGPFFNKESAYKGIARYIERILTPH